MATTTDLGKIMTTNGGEYDPETTYSEKTFVYYKGSTYLALKTNTGIEPSDDKINWQYFARGFADEDFVAEKYVYVDREDDSEFVDEPLIDADALGGNKPDFYAPQHEISDAFDDTKTYEVGNYTINQNTLYKFTDNKSPGLWDASKVIACTVMGEVGRTIWDAVDDYAPVELRRKLPRRKFLGTQVTDEQYARIADGSFKGFFPLDYWEIEGFKWVIMDFDYWLHSGNTVIPHHLAMMPSKRLYKSKWNNTQTVSGGYVNSYIRTTGLNNAKTIINNAFGSGHIVTYKENLSTNANDSVDRKSVV